MFDTPRATCRSTSTSRSVSPSTTDAVARSSRRANSSINRRVTDGANREPGSHSRRRTDGGTDHCDDHRGIFARDHRCYAKGRSGALHPQRVRRLEDVQINRSVETPPPRPPCSPTSATSRPPTSGTRARCAPRVSGTGASARRTTTLEVHRPRDRADLRGHRAPARQPFALRGENKTVVAHDTMDIEPAGTGTRVTYTADFEFRASRYVAPLLAPALRSSATRPRRGCASHLRDSETGPVQGSSRRHGHGTDGR